MLPACRALTVGGSVNNVVNIYNIGSGSLITGIAYNVNVTSYNPSWVSEIALFFGNSARTNGLIFTPGFGDEFSGNATYAGTVNLVALGLNTVVGADGLLRLEYFEEFNDFAGAADGIWNSGTITFTYSPTISAAVPESATWAMMLAGFGLIGSGMRRRSAVKARVTYA